MMRIPGLKTLRRHGRQLAARVRPSALVLGYHRVTGTGADPYGMAVSRDRFERQMERVAGRGDARPLAEIADPLTGRGGRLGGIAITFDDGYAGTVEIARPVLERFGLPFTVFVTTGGLGRRFWWHRLASIVHAFGETGRVLDAGGEAGSWAAVEARDDHTPEERLERAYAAFAVMAPGARSAILDRIEASGAVAVADEHDGERAMNEDELRALADSPCASVGAHGVTHAPLAELDAADAALEIRESRDTLVRITGRPVRSFSYPHGSTSAAVGRLVRDAGLDVACASEPSPVFAGADPLRLPRVWVRDDDGPAFERWLAGWTGD